MFINSFEISVQTLYSLPIFGQFQSDFHGREICHIVHTIFDEVNYLFVSTLLKGSLIVEFYSCFDSNSVFVWRER